MWASKKFRIFRLKSKINLSKYRYTIDILEDFKLFCFILDSFPRKHFYKIGEHEVPHDAIESLEMEEVEEE